MDLQLTDKIAVVTGASKGIGLAITQAFLAEGARVVAGARNVDSLQNLAGVTPVALDLTTPEGPRTLAVLLASERTANVTGANYVIDGGLIKTT